MRNVFYLVMLLYISAASYAADNVVARVNNAAITSADLEAAVDRLIPRSAYHGTLAEDRRDEFRRKALEDLIDHELQYQDAVARGMKPARKEVKKWMKQVRKGYKSKKEYQAALAQSGMSEGELRKQIEKNVLVQTVIHKTVTEPAEMTEAGLREYYKKNIDKFRQPESVRLRIISTKNKGKAREILNRIKAGDDFGALAAKKSEDKFRIRGGDMGYIHRGRILPEAETVAFSLKAGEVSGLVETQGTWLIMKVEDRRPEHQLSFEEARDKLKKKLEARRAEELMKKWVADLRAKAKIEIVIKK